MMLASTHNYELYSVPFTRVTELLDNPKDTKAAARMFLEELCEFLDGDMDDSVTVLAAAGVTDEDCQRDEIEYSFIVLTTPEIAASASIENTFEFLEIAR